MAYASKQQKMQEFVPSASPEKCNEVYVTLRNAIADGDMEKLLAAIEKYGGVIGYKALCYTLHFAQNGETPPWINSENVQDNEIPASEENLKVLDMLAFLTK